MSGSVNIGGAWKAISAVSANIGGEWKAIDTGSVNIGGAWKSWWTSVIVSAWTTIDPLDVGRFGSAGFGTSSACDCTGGHTGSAITAEHEYYNGTAWATSGQDDLSSASYLGHGFGTHAAGAHCTGYNNLTATQESSSGTVAAGGNYPNVLVCGAAVGTQNDAMTAGGCTTNAYADGAGVSTSCNNYDGSAWTSSADTLNTARAGLALFGTPGDCVAAGGWVASAAGTNTCERFDGSAWTTDVSNLPYGSAVSLQSGGSAAASTAGGFVVFAGSASGGTTAIYNGSSKSWSDDEEATPGTLSDRGFGCGTATSGIYGGMLSEGSPYTACYKLDRA